MSKPSSALIPNQIFIGLPWKLRKMYDPIVEKLEKTFPLTFFIMGRNDKPDAEELLSIIKEKISSSSYAIFDATGHNANVSLEYGFAEAWNINRAIFTCVHKASKRSLDGASIISDLAGKKRNQYTQKNSLSKLLHDLARNHAYNQRFESFLSSRESARVINNKKTRKAIAFKVIRASSGNDPVRRETVVQELLAGSTYKRKEIEGMIKALHNKSLIQVSRGRTSYVQIK